MEQDIYKRMSQHEKKNIKEETKARLVVPILGVFLPVRLLVVERILSVTSSPGNTTQPTCCG